ncbi:hypothetical protein [Microvirga sp. VF16]|uniref:hypothetical protein n=1 Tax=Microvirga sp. VF16 TaxID=2807101 RepID=UPI00193D3C0B|nr:hypothetical protein [Microvirga sp. VF16]QRM36098.1 hypothetical protein JO965_45910 [Microvirga sp. VF16]
MRLPPVLLICLTLAAGVLSGGRQQAQQPLPLANVGDTWDAPVASIAPVPSNAKHITYNGAGGYVLPDESIRSCGARRSPAVLTLCL